jgi:hypothetical protein
MKSPMEMAVERSSSASQFLETTETLHRGDYRSPIGSERFEMHRSPRPIRFELCPMMLLVAGFQKPGLEWVGGERSF